MKTKIICDTGVISRYLTNHPNFQTIIDTIEQIGKHNICICAVTRIELFNWLSGYQNLDKSLRANLKQEIKNLEVLHCNEAISKIATEISDKHINSKPIDTLIGATALYHQTKILTINSKDFKQIKAPLYE